MSALLLERLDAERAFLPRRRFDELVEDHVAFDDLNDRGSTERDVERLIVADEGVIAVVGPSGSGKSSVIAAVTTRLPERFAPVRVRVAALGDEVRDPDAMVVHVLREVRQHAFGAQLTKEQRRTLEKATASRRTRVGPQARASLATILPGFTPELRGELTSARLDEEYARDRTDALAALGRLRGMFEAHDRIPVLIMDDTDAWLRGPAGGADPDPDVAGLFFQRTIARFAREQELSVVVAVHDTYRKTAGYEQARQVFAGEIEVPELTRPAEALRTILQRRIARSQVEASVDEVLEDPAVVRLEAEYDNGARDLRRVLRVTDTALSGAGPPFPERLTAAHVRAAAIADHAP